MRWKTINIFYIEERGQTRRNAPVSTRVYVALRIGSPIERTDFIARYNNLETLYEVRQAKCEPRLYHQSCSFIVFSHPEGQLAPDAVICCVVIKRTTWCS